MFKSVRIRNFRQFHDLEFKGLAPINLITGKNSAGKTSLLEAVYLLDGPVDPPRTVTIAQFRGIGGITSGSPELWEWLFRNRDTSQPIMLCGKARSGPKTELNVRLSRGSLIPTTANGVRGGVGASPSFETAGPLPALVYESRIDGETQPRVELSWSNDGLRLDPDLKERRAQGFFLPEILRPGHVEAIRLSRLAEVGREGMLVDALRVIEPRLKQLRVLDFGDGARVYADIGELPPKPLNVLGQGVGRLLMIVAPMILDETSVYFIDEISEGFHYSTLADVWRVIVNVAIEHSAQVFATTHSYECIQAAVKGAEGNEDKLALFRLSRREDDIRATRVEHEGIKAAVDFALELR
jgi:hypothetical protein